MANSFFILIQHSYAFVICGGYTLNPQTQGCAPRSTKLPKPKTKIIPTVEDQT